MAETGMYDAIVVGAGIAGASVGAELAGTVRAPVIVQAAGAQAELIGQMGTQNGLDCFRNGALI